MSSRKEYARIREVELPPSSSGRPHYAELRFNPDHGPIEEFCVGYKVWYGGEYVEIVRYDSDHDMFHRHSAGYPESGGIEEWFDVPMNQRGSFAVKDIKRNCEGWQSVLPITGERKEEPKA